jgi:hypothetical protein
MYGFSSQIMSYIFNMLICVGMILLDNLLQCFLFIAMIDLSRTCSSTATLISNALLMFMIYPWIKMKLKVLIFWTLYTCISTHAMRWGPPKSGALGHRPPNPPLRTDPAIEFDVTNGYRGEGGVNDLPSEVACCNTPCCGSHNQVT